MTMNHVGLLSLLLLLLLLLLFIGLVADGPNLSCPFLSFWNVYWGFLGRYDMESFILSEPTVDKLCSGSVDY